MFKYSDVVFWLIASKQISEIAKNICDRAQLNKRSGSENIGWLVSSLRAHHHKKQRVVNKILHSDMKFNWFLSDQVYKRRIDIIFGTWVSYKQDLWLWTGCT
jgi:hypothetical protein